MAKMGRPKVDKPADKKVTVRFTEEEHELLIEYTTKHDYDASCQTGSYGEING